jgi:hypothetical protein
MTREFESHSDTESVSCFMFRYKAQGFRNTHYSKGNCRVSTDNPAVHICSEYTSVVAGCMCARATGMNFVQNGRSVSAVVFYLLSIAS